MLFIKDSLRGVSSLPYSISDDEINRIIDLAKKWFYLHYVDAVELALYVIPSHLFQTSDFKKNRTIQLPDCIVSVIEVKEISGSVFGVKGPDISDNMLIASELFLNPLTSDNIVLRVVQFSFWDLSKAFILEDIGFDFNHNTHKLKIVGRDPQKNVLVRCYAQIPEENLFEDWYFQEYCINQSRISLANIISTFKYKLPGGVEIDVSDLKSTAQENLNKIIEDIQGGWSPPDYILITHS